MEDALNVFYNSFRANDYSELKALVEQAAELIRKAEAGEIACDAQDLQDLKDSYSTNAAALDATDQNVIDKAVKLLRRDIDIFFHYDFWHFCIASRCYRKGLYYEWNLRR